MSFFTCGWNEFVSEPLLKELQALTGEDISPYREVISARLAAIFKHTGGLPVWRTELSSAQRDSLAQKLLVDALGHFLAKAQRRPQVQVGHYLRNSDHSVFEREIKTAEVVEVNCADQDALEGLPMIGPVKAKAILEEKAEGGYFSSLKELANRVEGIGEDITDSWIHITRFKGPTIAPSMVEGGASPLGRALKLLLDEFRFVVSGSRLVSALEAVASLVATSPHPASAEQRPRFLFDFDLGPTSKADHVGLLEGRSYYRRLPEIFAGATSSICVAMFHAAFRDEEHPTGRLLDALVKAQARGVKVRVVLDRDRATDPYLSTVINSSAKAYLDAHGVACKFDREDVLLHSKFTVIDSRVCVIGSHNWSAGSFFHYDDLSFAVESETLAGQLIARFDSLWT
jgi:DNA uptake protein ComE-like DNA-binding protein